MLRTIVTLETTFMLRTDNILRTVIMLRTNIMLKIKKKLRYIAALGTVVKFFINVEL